MGNSFRYSEEKYLKYSPSGNQDIKPWGILLDIPKRNICNILRLVTKISNHGEFFLDIPERNI